MWMREVWRLWRVNVEEGASSRLEGLDNRVTSSSYSTTILTKF